MKIVIDSNILFSTLLSSDNRFKTLLYLSDYTFYSCNLLFVEIFKYKDKIKSVSKLTEDEILMQLGIIVSKIHFINEDVIPKEIFKRAYELCKDIDEKDTPFIALSIFLDAFLLTGDKELIEGLQNKGFDKIMSLKRLEEHQKDNK
jgi:predicted nucleic acid-binding protein